MQGCGYQSIHKIDKTNFTIIRFETNGDEKISRDLARNFEKLQINQGSKNRYELITNSQINKKVDSRNSSGVAENLSIYLIIKISVIENGMIIGEKSFQENSNYVNLVNKFELHQYEKIILKNLTAGIIKKISLYISSLSDY